MKITREGDQIILTTKENRITIDAKQLHIGDYSTEWPGEYEVGGVSARTLMHDNRIAAVIGAEEMRIMVLLGLETEIQSNEEEIMGEVDVLVCDAESGTLGAKQWKKWNEELSPRIVVFASRGERTDALVKEIGCVLDIQNPVEIMNNKLPSDKTQYLAIGV